MADLGALVFVPFIAWHAYRVRRGVRTGVFESLAGEVHRTSQPVAFWSSVAREMLLGALFLAMFFVVLLDFSRTTLVWLAIGYVVVYLGILVARMYGVRQRAYREPPGG